MAVITISEEEAGRELGRVLAHLRAGEDVVIASKAQPDLTIRSVELKDPSIDATLERLRRRSEARGYEAVMDADFAADMEEIIRNRKPRKSAWED